MGMDGKGNLLATIGRDEQLNRYIINRNGVFDNMWAYCVAYFMLCYKLFYWVFYWLSNTPALLKYIENSNYKRVKVMNFILFEKVTAMSF